MRQKNLVVRLPPTFFRSPITRSVRQPGQHRETFLPAYSCVVPKLLGREFKHGPLAIDAGFFASRLPGVISWPQSFEMAGKLEERGG